MGPKRTSVSNPSTSKTTAGPSKGKTPGKPTGKTAAPKKPTPPVKGAANKTGKGASGSKTVPKGNAKTKAPTKKLPSKEDIAATKIQTFVRGNLARRELEKIKQQKKEYDELIDKLQKEAWLDIIQRQRDEDEVQRLKEDEARKRKKEQLKWRKDILEAAFDGELEIIQNTIKQAVERTQKTSSLTGDGLERLIEKVRRGLIESEDANENSTLSEASAGGDLATIEYFIQNGILINQLGHFHRTPLYRAAFGGHLEAVKTILNHGGDPRIADSEGVLPEQVAASPKITEHLQSWDVSVTDTLITKQEEERERNLEEQRKQQQIENEKNEEGIRELEDEYENRQKILQKAYTELNKRISEHDNCVAEGFDRPEVTLQAIHDAEDHLLKCQKEERDCRDRLTAFRLKTREQKTEDNVDDGSVKCHIKELDDVLMRDVGNKIKTSGRWPIVIDASTQVVTFLKYRDTNLLNALNPKDMEAETLRLALLGAIRYGKLLILDMYEMNLLNLIENRFDDIQENLFKELISRDILKDRRYHSLIRATDGKDYAKENFVDCRVERFMLVLISKIVDVPVDWRDNFYIIKVVTPDMT